MKLKNNKKNIENQIHIVNNVFYGGGEQVFEELSKYSESVVIYFLRNTSGVNSKRIMFLTPINAKSSYGCLDQILNCILIFLAVFPVIVKNKSERFVFHGFPFQYFMPIFRVLVSKKLHFVFHQLKSNTKFLNKLALQIEKITLKGCHVYAVSDLAKKNIEKYFSNQMKINIFRNCYSRLKTVSDVKSSSRLFSAAKIEDTPFLLYVARFQKFKNHEAFLELRFLEFLKDSGYLCVLIGEGPTMDSFRRSVSKTAVADKFKFVGSVDRRKLYSFYSNSSAIIFPSFAEAFGIAILEALEFEKPVYVWHDVAIRSDGIFPIETLLIEKAARNFGHCTIFDWSEVHPTKTLGCLAGE